MYHNIISCLNLSGMLQLVYHVLAIFRRQKVLNNRRQGSSVKF